MENKWTSVIKSRQSYFSINIREIIQYRDLLMLFVKRDFVAIYKQTILGPLWFFIQPIFTTLMFTVVFGNIAGISTDGIPKILFYLGGLTFWNFFADNLNKTSVTFLSNQSVFGKVYFPRLVTPISIVVSNLLKFGIQFVLFLSFFLYYFFIEKAAISMNWAALLFPILILITSMLGLGFGLIVTSLTTKYRDLKFLINFGVTLWMYITPVIYPLSKLEGNIRMVALLNPMTSIIETFKYGFLGSGHFTWLSLLYSFVFSIVVLAIGALVFNKTEQNFMDTI